MIPNPTHPVLDGSRHGRLFGCVVSIITFAMIHDSRPLPAMEGSAWITPYLYGTKISDDYRTCGCCTEPHTRRGSSD